MFKIHQLKSELIDQIAAGEVIDRPASVLKELIENSLDAGSSSIRINTVQGGLDSISIADNGNGISKNEMVLVFERFATSKVETLHDLDSICSLGFRGEAMYSISSVSKVELVSSTDLDTRGSRIVFRNGELKSWGKYNPNKEENDQEENGASDKNDDNEYLQLFH